MSRPAAVFPGQGSQVVGMGRTLASASPAARAVFEEVDEALGERLSRVIFEGPAELLTATENAQPALLATSIAAQRALEERLGRPLGAVVCCVAGHSLGEYSALVAAGSLALSDAARLLRLRGAAMQRAVPPGAGAMAAILGLEAAVVVTIAAEAAGDQVCQLANDNADGQAVVSGHKEAVERAVALAKERGAKRAVMLQVSAPFHCALMAPAAEELAPVLARTRFAPPAVPLIANVTAEPVRDPELFAELLYRQVTGRVRWRESMATMVRMGVDLVLELGPGKVLSGLAKRAMPGVRVLALGEAAELDAAAAALVG
ncbi:MAG: ACP S-malonyltransferase [Geminicoccaceae bacterium]|nr:ACP S-malonyltransferase [Geminicoccaceae bacterium]MCX7630020.1 ACP S-malonyltransferase [Geminicoccaceae bacterium]MDW8124988.1 ACP S-malonyltransferase [Geminicoccaceae bacterium]MDW8341710.1 ACP S-malonyltransferase [Geminicoccaceae bacterium]